MGGRGTPGNAASVMQQQPYEAVNLCTYLTLNHSLEVDKVDFTHCRDRQTQLVWQACQEEVARLTK